MKQLALPIAWQMDNSVPALTGGDLLHLDGQCFVGDAGILGVALTPGSLARLRRDDAPTQWLLPVENPAIAAVAGELPGEIYWLSRRPPVRVLGGLVNEFRGAWLDGDEVVMQLDAEPHRLRMERNPSPAFALAYLARLITQVWMGDATAGRTLYPFSSPSRSNLMVA